MTGPRLPAVLLLVAPGGPPLGVDPLCNGAKPVHTPRLAPRRWDQGTSRRLKIRSESSMHTQVITASDAKLRHSQSIDS